MQCMYLLFVLVIVVIRETFALNPDIQKYDEWVKDAEARVKKIKADEKRRAEYQWNKDTYIHEKRSADFVKRITRQKDVDFRMAVKEDKLIIDKTRFIPKLLEFMTGNQFFMVRPSRFGKSFFLTTLKAFFEGDEDLFCSPERPKFDICNHKLKWEKYPIFYLYLGFSSVSDDIIASVQYFAQKYEIVTDKKESDISKLMNKIFTEIKRRTNKKIVVLVDEYDLRVTVEYFTDVSLSKLTEVDIGTFFQALKANAHLIHFAFITGITKVTPVGGRFNVINDLTRSDEFSDLIGFTEEEIIKTYNERLEQMSHERKYENVKTFFEKELRPYYKGYRFSPSGVTVYNPVTITSFLIENPEKPEPYWAMTVTNRELLENTIEKFSYPAYHLLLNDTHICYVGKLEEELDHDKILQGDETELSKILFQCGYLTLEKIPTDSESCALGVVNEEARYAIKSSLRIKVWPLLRQMEKMLEERDFENFIETLEKAVAKIMTNRYFKSESQYEKVVSFLLGEEGETGQDLIDVGVASANMMQQKFIHQKIAEEERNIWVDYIKVIPYSEVIIIFSFKKYSPGQALFNTTFELLRCHSVYLKIYTSENPEKQVMCIVLIFYTEAGQVRRVTDERLRNTGREYIMDWAALEWFEKEKKVEVYNLHPALNDKQLKEVAKYIGTT